MKEAAVDEVKAAFMLVLPHWPCEDVWKQKRSGQTIIESVVKLSLRRKNSFIILSFGVTDMILGYGQGQQRVCYKIWLGWLGTPFDSLSHSMSWTWFWTELQIEETPSTKDKLKYDGISDFEKSQVQHISSTVNHTINKFKGDLHWLFKNLENKGIIKERWKIERNYKICTCLGKAK